MAASKDYYQILGLKESSSADEIKSAYRNLAKKYHPDANPNNKSAEEKFKEISEAYYVLSEPGKRREYDQFKRSGFSAGTGSRGGFQGAQGFNYEDILRAARGAQSGRRTSFHFGGSARGFEDIFSGLFGGVSEGREYGGSDTEMQTVADINATLRISRVRAQKGGEVTFTTQQGRKITVKIPPGIISGKKLRLARQGAECPTCLHPGDLLLTIKVEA